MLMVGLPSKQGRAGISLPTPPSTLFGVAFIASLPSYLDTKRDSFQSSPTPTHPQTVFGGRLTLQLLSTFWNHDPGRELQTEWSRGGHHHHHRKLFTPTSLSSSPIGKPVPCLPLSSLSVDVIRSSETTYFVPRNSWNAAVVAAIHSLVCRKF